MAKPIDLRPRGEQPAASEPSTRSRVFFDAALAEIFRKLCRYEGKDADQMLDAMVRLWVKERAPQLELVEADESAEERRQGERRTRIGTSSLYPTENNKRSGEDRRRGE